MYTTYFIIPKAVYFYCILPALFIIIASILFSIFYYKKKGTLYYVYTLNFVYHIASILLCLLLFPLLLGYSLAMGVVIYNNLIVDVSFLLVLMLVLLPIVPFVTLIVVCFKFINNIDYKKRLDELKKENDLEMKKNA